MKKLSSTYKQGDVLVLPFPFTDADKAKKRPVVVLSSLDSFHTDSGHCVVAMITSAKKSAWLSDVAINDLQSAGLQVNCSVRMKIFSIDQSLMLYALGKLHKNDLQRVLAAVKTIFSF